MTTPDLIPRKTLFGSPSRASATVSPDGSRIAFLAPLDGVLNVWVAPLDAPQAAKPVTNDSDRGIRDYFWTRNPDYLIYSQDAAGDENWRLYAVDVANGEARDLTPFEGVHAIPHTPSEDFPNEIVVGLNLRDPQLHDLYRIDLLTGESRLALENDIGAAGFLIDRRLNARLASVTRDDGGEELLLLDARGGWRWLMTIAADDAMTTAPLSFDADGRSLYMFDSRARDTAALTVVDTASGETRTLHHDARADVSRILAHPRTGAPQAAGVERDKLEWTPLDDSIADDLGILADACGGQFQVVSRSADMSKWIALFERDDEPPAYWLYRRGERQLEFLFSTRPELAGAPLASMTSAVVKSRDGLDLLVYYSLPVEATVEASPYPSRPLPTVLLVHGGPWGRDGWGFDAYHQLLANRGYAVVSVNFRGSTGFGKAFVNAANREWGGKMHDDLIDAVDWAVERGIARRERIAIMGGSYGGYAALAGLAFTPDVFACGVDIVGPSNLNTLLDSIPPYWKPMAAMLRARVGDNASEEGRRFLESRSPLSRVDAIARPLLVAQGANDPRVKRAESDQIVAAMRERGIPVAYALYPDEGHGFARPENSLSFMAVAESFLSRCLGGGREPIGVDFDGSSITVPVGAGEIDGLEAALAASG